MKRLVLLQVIVILTICASANEQVNKILELLKDGDEKIELSDRYKNVTLVLGNTGSGKSTFVQWFAGDNSKLIATEVTEDSGDYKIVDHGNRINDGVNSKTIFPELVIKNETNEAFYDCPGFGDTRNTNIDIANSYFIKKLTDFADYIKILLVINHSSVQKSVDRVDFPKLMKHVTELVKDVKKYESSIAMAVTKVSDFRIVKGRPEITPDDVVIGKIGDFLKQVQTTLFDKKTDSEVSEQDRKVNEDTLKVLDVLLTKNDGKFAKIGLFKKPLESGPLSENEDLQNGKHHIERILNELTYTARSYSDFGYTVSEKSLNDIHTFSDQLLIEVEKDLNSIIEQLTTYYQNAAKLVNNRITNFDAFSENDQVFSSFNAIRTGSKVMSILMKNMENVGNITQIAEEIENMMTQTGFKCCEDNIKRLKVLGGHLNFFETVKNKKLSTKSWEKSFKPLAQFLDNSRSSIETSIKNAQEKIQINLNDHFKNVMNEIEFISYQAKSKKTSIDKSISNLKRGQTVLSQLISNLEETTPRELSNLLSSYAYKLDVDSFEIKNPIARIARLGRFSAFLTDLNPEISFPWSSDWITSSEQTLKYFSNSEIWFKFLRSLYKNYSIYKVQKTSNLNKNFKVTPSTFSKFIADLKNFNIENYDENFELTEDRLTTLNQVLSSTLGTGIETSCSDSGEMIVKGDFIKVSDFTSANGNIMHNCKTSLKSLKIFAMNTFFADRDLNGFGSKLQLSIFAPKWWIVDSYKINLDGEDSQHVYTQKAEDGLIQGVAGSNGKPGLPGGNAGNFVGIGSEFINIQSLTISANGGRGSRGQDGGNGAVGKKGEKASTYTEFIKENCGLPMFDKILHIEYECFNYGKDGGAGGNGGDAGAGGLGGLSGKIFFHKLDNSKEMPKMIINQGSNGEDGTPGQQGRQGEHGKNYYFIYCSNPPFVDYLCPGGHEKFVESKKSRNDTKTLSGVTNSGIEQPAIPVEFQDIGLASNDYKRVLRENFGNIYNTNTMTSFFSDLNDNKILDDFTNTLSLTNDLMILEQQETQLNSLLDRETIIFFYESFLNQTSEYSQNPQLNERTLQHKKVLGYLYTAAVSRLYNIKVDADGMLIVDLDKYLGSVKKEVNGLRNLQNNHLKSQVIETHNEKYKSGLEGKVEEAGKFINEQVKPEIDKTKVQLDRNIDTLIGETLTLQEGALEETDKLKKTRDKLKIAIITSRVFSVLQITAQIAGCFCGVGAPIAAAIGGVGKVANHFILDGTDKKTKNVELPKGVTEDLKKMVDKTEGIFKTSKHMDRAVEYAKVGAEVFEKYKDDSKAMKEVNEAIEKAQKKYKNLQKYENSIYETMIPSMKNMQRDLDDLAKSLDGKSHVALDVTKWQVKTALTDMRSAIKQFTKDFSIEDELARNIEKIEEAMTTIIDIYNRIETYQEQKMLADYLANIVSAGSTAIIVSDTKLNNAVNELELMIRSNIVLNRYEEVFNAMKQQVFPLAHVYLPKETLPSYLEQFETFEDLTNEAMAKIDKMMTQLIRYKSSITNFDEYLSRGKFTSDGVSSKPFYVWKNENYNKAIYALLTGQKITIKSDVSSLQGKDAVKFNEIDINFKSTNQSVTRELRQKLNGFKVSVGHLGNSYYRFNENIYVIPSRYQNIVYNFERDDEGRPMENNAVYDKLKNGNLMLSPYAMWEIQLTNLTSDITFNDLKNYRGLVDLELIGSGTYIEQGSKIFNIDINTYYEDENNASF